MLVLLIAIGVILAVGNRSIAQQAATTPPVPVTTTSAVRQDVPIYLRGLGSVQAFNAVLVRARVDGTLMQVPVTEGQDVKQGDLIAVIDPRPFQAALDAATAKKAQDEADLANASQDLTRYSALAVRNFASHQQVDTQRALVSHLTATIAGDDAAIESARLNLSYCYITSSIPGRIGLRMVDPGNMVHASDATGIVSITQIHPISVLFTLPQEDLSRINAAMRNDRLAVVAFAADAKTELDQGTLLTPDNAIDATTGTIRLKATFPNPNNALWPGQFVNARLQLGVERNVVTVPSFAVQHGLSGLYVYVVRPDSTVQRQPVQVEDRGPVMIVTKGLDAGQEIVLDGQSRLENGTVVTATKSGSAAARQAGG